MILPLLAVLFGALDLAFAIFVKNTVQFAVCQGVRYAATSQTKAGMGHDDPIKAVVQSYTMGFLDSLSTDHAVSCWEESYLDHVLQSPGTYSGNRYTS